MVSIKNISKDESFVDSINKNGLSVSLLEANSPVEKIFFEINKKDDSTSSNFCLGKF